MSRALGRLRQSLSDPLLVRAGRRMVLTPHAIALRDRVNATRAEANELLGPAACTALTEIRRTMVIRCSDAATALLAAPLHARMAVEAPLLSLRFAPEGDEDVAALRDGNVDLDIGVANIVEPELRTRRLFRDRFVAVMGHKHRLVGQRLTAKRLAAETHIAVSRLGKASGPIDKALESMGLQRHVAAVVPTFLAAMFAVSCSDLVTAVPHRLATLGEEVLPIRHLRMPLELPEICISMAWHPRIDGDPAHRWLRQQIVEVTKTTATVSRSGSQARRQ